MFGMLQPEPILIALFVTAFGMAASSTITEAVIVENGNRLGTTGRFLNQQWLWFNVATVVASLAAGWLAQNLAPTRAFHTAALIACVAPLTVAALSWLLIAETRTPAPPKAQRALPPVLKSRVFWVTAAFLFLWNIVPSFGTPLYYHMVDDLKFDQRLIGILAAVAALGSVVGGLAYTKLAKKLDLSKLLYLSLALTTVSQLLFVWLNSPAIAIAINFVNGLCAMIALVSSLTVAGHAAPDKAAGFTFALLMSVNNLAGQLASNIGAYMFVHWFHKHLDPVIYIACATTAACAVLVPMLKLGNQRGDSLTASVRPQELVRIARLRPANTSPSGF
jgi:MFS family permease